MLERKRTFIHIKKADLNSTCMYNCGREWRLNIKWCWRRGGHQVNNTRDRQRQHVETCNASANGNVGSLSCINPHSIVGCSEEGRGRKNRVKDMSATAGGTANLRTTRSARRTLRIVLNIH